MSNFDLSTSAPSVGSNAESQILETDNAIATEIISENPAPVTPPALSTEPPEEPMNYFVRHWKGDLPLGISYWCNGVCLSAIIMALSASLSEAEEKISLRTGSALVFLIYFFTIIVGVWQIVGTWRSASKHRDRGGQYAWAAITKFLI